MNQETGYLVFPQENNCTFTKIITVKVPQVCSSGDYFKLCFTQFLSSLHAYTLQF